MHTTSSGFLYRHDDQPKFSRSRSIQVSESIDLIFVAHHFDHSLVDLIDHNFTNIFVTFSLQDGGIDASFSQLLEDLNREISQIQLRQSLSGLSLFVGVVEKGFLTFSVIGDGLQGLLVGVDSVSDIFDGMAAEDDIRFAYDSRGQVTDKEFVMIAATDMLTLFSFEEMQDLAQVSWSKRIGCMDERVRISNGSPNTAYVLVGYDHGADVVEAVDVYSKKKGLSFSGGFSFSRILPFLGSSIMKGFEKMQKMFNSLPNTWQYGVFGVSILLALILLYTVISTAMSSQKEIFVPQEYEDMYTEAVASVNNAINSSGNPEAFQGYILTARNLLDTIEQAGVLKSKVDELNTLIASKEKQFNQITTLSSYQVHEQFSFEEPVDLVSVFVHEGQQYFVTSSQIIGPHIQGSTPEQYPFPDGSKALFADIDDSGKIFVYTEDQKVLQFQKGAFKTLEVRQVDGWDAASGIEIYNQNIYLLSSDRKQIYKHRKIGSQYDGKSLMIQESASDFGFAISDYDIDGGVYVFKDNTLIDKIFTAPKYERRSIVINNLGTNIFRHNDSKNAPRVIVGDPDVSHVFVLLNGKIWIFEPNSKRFSDVKSLQYVGQLEIPNIDVHALWVLQTGVLTDIYFADQDARIYRVKVTIQDGVIEVKG